MTVDSIIIRRSPIILLFKMLALTAFIALVYFIYGFLQALFAGVALSDTALHPALIFLIALSTEALMMIIIFLRWVYKTFELKDSELVSHAGLVIKKSQIYPLLNIQSVEVKQGVLGVFFHFGTIKLYNPMWKKDVELTNISDPEKHAIILRKILEKNTEKIIKSQVVI